MTSIFQTDAAPKPAATGLAATVSVLLDRIRRHGEEALIYLGELSDLAGQTIQQFIRGPIDRWLRSPAGPGTAPRRR